MSPRHEGEPRSSKTLEDYLTPENERRQLASAWDLWTQDLDWSKPLARHKFLTDPALIRSFAEINRADFMMEGTERFVGVDQPIDIGFGQSISQPTLVAKMLESLKPQPNSKILDIGSGSGYTTALLANTVGQSGFVIATEAIPGLVEFANSNLNKYKNLPAFIRNTDSLTGASDQAPFDRILVSACINEYDLDVLCEQLNPTGGRLVTPIISRLSSDSYNQDIILVTLSDGERSVYEVQENVEFTHLIRWE